MSAIPKCHQHIICPGKEKTSNSHWWNGLFCWQLAQQQSDSMAHLCLCRDGCKMQPCNQVMAASKTEPISEAECKPTSNSLLDSALDVINALQQLSCSFMSVVLNQALRNCVDDLTDALLLVVHGYVDSALPHLCGKS